MIKKKKQPAKHRKHEISPKLSKELFPDPADIRYQEYIDFLRTEMLSGVRCVLCGNILKQKHTIICEQCKKEVMQ